jgi:hypothetical protein
VLIAPKLLIPGSATTGLCSRLTLTLLSDTSIPRVRSDSSKKTSTAFCESSAPSLAYADLEDDVSGVGLEVGRFVEHVKQGTRAIESVTLRIAWSRELPDRMKITLSSFPVGLLRTMARGAERPSD